MARLGRTKALSAQLFRSSRATVLTPAAVSPVRSSESAKNVSYFAPASGSPTGGHGSREHSLDCADRCTSSFDAGGSRRLTGREVKLRLAVCPAKKNAWSPDMAKTRLAWPSA